MIEVKAALTLIPWFFSLNRSNYASLFTAQGPKVSTVVTAIGILPMIIGQNDSVSSQSCTYLGSLGITKKEELSYLFLH